MVACISAIAKISRDEQTDILSHIHWQYENDRDESCVLRSESVPNHPNGRLNVRIDCDGDNATAGGAMTPEELVASFVVFVR